MEQENSEYTYQILSYRWNASFNYGIESDEIWNSYRNLREVNIWKMPE